MVVFRAHVCGEECAEGGALLEELGTVLLTLLPQPDRSTSASAHPQTMANTRRYDS